MLTATVFLLLIFGQTIHSQTWNTSGLRPWESYLSLGDIQRPLGLTLNRSSLAHHHFAIGYLCLHSFLYDEAQSAFDLAITINNTFIEPYIGKILGYKQSLWSYTNFPLGQKAYNQTQAMLNSSNITLSHLQSSLLTTAYQWYADPSNTTAGEWAFLSSIANLSQTFPNETDIRVLWGLSLLNVADEVQFQSEMEPEKMLEARQILKTALEKEPNHPGTLHYLIHAYDVVQVNISQQATEYASAYGSIVTTASHAQHMPSHIWMRIGSWNRSASADGAGIISSLALCATKLLDRQISISSTELMPVLNLFNTSNQTSYLLDCDRENRAHSIEWLAYSRLQMGDWSGSVALLQDSFIANNRSTITPNHYLPFAYRTQARSIIELFFWFPYQYQFLNRTQQLLALNGTQTIVSIGDNTTRWYPIWSEAGLLFSECLRLVVADNSSNTASTVNGYLDRLATLSNRSASLNQYVSTSISMMISQIRGIRHYMNESWQECLNELNNATQRESTLVADANSPTLIFARSSELLAMHLLLISNRFDQQSARSILSVYLLNGTNVAVADFPSRALSLYQNTNSSAPNRVINTLGMARAYLQMDNGSEATRLYQVLLNQIQSSASSDPIFSEEALNVTSNYTSTYAPSTTLRYSTTVEYSATMGYSTTVGYSSAATNTYSFLLLTFIFCILYIE